MRSFRFRSSLKKAFLAASPLVSSAEDVLPCGRRSSSSHARKNFWHPGYHNWGKFGELSLRLYIENAVARNKPCTRSVSEWVKKIATRSWVELHFTIISYILSFNYSYRYEINLIRIMYATNSSILYSKEKTGQILGKGGSRGRVQGGGHPPPRDDLRFSNTTGIL